MAVPGVGETWILRRDHPFATLGVEKKYFFAGQAILIHAASYKSETVFDDAYSKVAAKLGQRWKLS